MRKFLFILFVCLGQLALAQSTPDKINKKDKTIIDAIVVEISKNEIQYKKFSSPNGATFSVPTAEVSSIVYASGYIDVMDVSDAPVASPIVKNTTIEPRTTTDTSVHTPSKTDATNTSPTVSETASAEKKAKKSKNKAATGPVERSPASGDESKTTVTKLDGKQEAISLPSSDFTGLDIDKIPKSGLDKDERLPAEYAGEYQWKSSDKGGREIAWLFEWDNVTLIAKEWMGYGWRVHSSKPKEIKMDGNKLVIKKKVIGRFVRFSRGGQEIRGFEPELSKKEKKDKKAKLFLIKVS